MLEMESPVLKRGRMSLKRNMHFGSLEKKSEPSLFGPLQELEPQLNSIFNSENIQLTSQSLSDIQDENTSPNILPLQPTKQTVEVDNSMEPVLGLPNCGNTCYLNSALQVLRYTPRFLESLQRLLSASELQNKLSSSDESENVELSFFQNLYSLYVAMNRQEIEFLENSRKHFNYQHLVRPMESLLTVLRKISPQFKENEQHDTHELLLTIISLYSAAYDKVKKELCDAPASSESAEPEMSINVKPQSRRNRKTLFGPRKRRREKKKEEECALLEEMDKSASLEKMVESASLEKMVEIEERCLDLAFKGKLCNIVKCLGCEIKQEKEEDFSDLEISIQDDESSGEVQLTDCLPKSYVLNGDNKYYCEQCRHLSEAKLSSEIVELPLVLLFHLSWLSKFCDTTLEINGNKLRIPLMLQNPEINEMFSRVPDLNYELYSMVFHIGTSSSGGHYVAFVKVSTAGNLCLKIEKDSSSANTTKDASWWILFDDETVTRVCVENSDIFPYYDYLSSTATPSLVFYQRK